MEKTTLYDLVVLMASYRSERNFECADKMRLGINDFGIDVQLSKDTIRLTHTKVKWGKDHEYDPYKLYIDCIFYVRSGVISSFDFLYGNDLILYWGFDEYQSWVQGNVDMMKKGLIPSLTFGYHKRQDEYFERYFYEALIELRLFNCRRDISFIKERFFYFWGVRDALWYLFRHKPLDFDERDLGL